MYYVNINNKAICLQYKCYNMKRFGGGRRRLLRFPVRLPIRMEKAKGGIDGGNAVKPMIYTGIYIVLESIEAAASPKDSLRAMRRTE